jgi:hypothetical protein
MKPQDTWGIRWTSGNGTNILARSVSALNQMQRTKPID